MGTRVSGGGIGVLDGRIRHWRRAQLDVLEGGRGSEGGRRRPGGCRRRSGGGIWGSGGGIWGTGGGTGALERRKEVPVSICSTTSPVKLKIYISTYSTTKYQKCVFNAAVRYDLRQLGIAPTRAAGMAII